MINWEIGIDIYTVICIKWITNKNLLYKKINKIFKKINKKLLEGENPTGEEKYIVSTVDQHLNKLVQRLNDKNYKINIATINS